MSDHNTVPRLAPHPDCVSLAPVTVSPRLETIEELMARPDQTWVRIDALERQLAAALAQIQAGEKWASELSEQLESRADMAALTRVGILLKDLSGAVVALTQRMDARFSHGAQALEHVRDQFQKLAADRERRIEDWSRQLEARVQVLEQARIPAPY